MKHHKSYQTGIEKWRSSRQIFLLNIDLSCPNPPEDWHSIIPEPSGFDQPNMYLDEIVGGYVLGSRGRPGFTELPSVVIAEAHIERLQRVCVSQ